MKRIFSRQTRSFPAGKRRGSIRSKLLLSYFALLAVVVSILLPAMLRITARNIDQKDKSTLAASQRQMTDFLSQCNQAMAGCGNAVLSNLNYISIDWWEQADYLSRVAIMSRVLPVSNAMYPQVDAVLFIDTDHNVYATDAALERRCRQNFPALPMEALRATHGRSINLGVTGEPGLTTEEDGRALLVGKRVLHISSGRTLGYVFVMMDEKALAPKYGAMKMYDDSEVFLINQDNEIVSSPDPALLGRQFSGEGLRAVEALSPLHFGGRSVSILSISGVPLFLVQTIAASEIYAGLYLVIATLGLIALVSMIAAVVLAVFLSRTLTNPLRELSDSMEAISGGVLTVRCNVATNDEISFLADEFNKMVFRIQELIDRVRAEQREKRRFELEVLLNQINPHFLYNTLNIIYSLCQVERYEDAENTIRALSDYYRIVLSSGESIIPLRDDVKNARDYLTIQKQLFEDAFDYDLVVVDEELLSRDIVKLTIQPLVENAVKYGLRPKEEKGFLYIEISGGREYTQIIVMDDGAGMPEERLREVREGKRSGHFGIRSVIERLQLYFQDQCAMEIDSAPNCGTTVRLTIPAYSEERRRSSDDSHAR